MLGPSLVVGRALLVFLVSLRRQADQVMYSNTAGSCKVSIEFVCVKMCFDSTDSVFQHGCLMSLSMVTEASSIVLHFPIKANSCTSNCYMSHPIPNANDSHSIQIILPQKQLGRKSEI